MPSSLLETILTIMHVRLRCPLPTQLLRIFERYFIAFRVKGTIDVVTSSCSFCVARTKFPTELDDFSPSPGPLHPGSHMNSDVLRRASQLILVNVDRFSNFVTACHVASETREDMVQGILAVVTPVRHCSKVQVRTDRAKALGSLAERPDPQLQDNGIDIVLGDHANPNKNASVDKAIQELEAELRRISPEGKPVSVGTLCQAVTELNNRIRGHGLTASQVHFSRDFNTGENLTIRDKKLWQERETRKAATKPKSSPLKTPDLRPGQVVFIKKEGDKQKARDPLIVTDSGTKVTVQKMLHMDPLSSAPPRITSQKLRIDPKFLYVPPHRRQIQDGSWRRTQRPAHWLPPARPTPPPPPLNDWRPSSPINDEDEDDVVTIITTTVADTPDIGGQGDAMGEEEGEVGAEDEAVMAEAGGGEVAGEGGEGREAVRPRALPPLLQAQLNQIRRRVDWGGGGQLVGQEVQNPVQEVQQQQQQPPPAQVVIQEEIVAQAQNRGITRGGRTTKAPTWYGIEKDRGEDDEGKDLNVSGNFAQRDDTPEGSLTASTPNLSPVGTPMITPLTTPNTSPDISVVSGRQPWELSPNKAPGRTRKQREENVMERHRHLSDPGPGVRLRHPAFQDWDPGPPRGGNAAQEL